MKRESGQTLFELVIALGIGVIIVTAVVGLVTVALRNSNFAKNKTEANKYAQEGIEWLRSEKKKDWASFFSKSANPAYYCLQTLVWPGQGHCTSSQTISGSTSFTREAALTTKDIDGDGVSDDVEAIVTVTWSEGGRTHSSQAATQFGNIK